MIRRDGIETMLAEFPVSPMMPVVASDSLPTLAR